MIKNLLKDTSAKFIHISALMIIGLIIYANSLHGEFIADDFGSILAHAKALSTFNLIELWQAYSTRLIGGLTFAINYQLSHEDVLSYHFFNVMIHILNAVLFYHFILQIFTTPVGKKSSIVDHAGGVAFLSAVLFLVHPIQSQAVAYIVQRYISLATSLCLASILFYGKARLMGDKKYYFISFLFLVFAMFTKESAYPFFILIILYDIIFWGKTTASLKRVGAYGLSALLFISYMLRLSTSRVEQNLFVDYPSSSMPSLWNLFLTQLNVLRTYFRLLILPYKQSYSYDYNIVSHLDLNTLVSIILLSSIGILAVYLYKKNKLIPFFTILWYFLTLSIHALFVIVYGQNGDGLLNDHWLYLPTAGFALFIVYTLVDLVNIKNARRILFMVLIVFCVLTFQRNKVWRSSTTLWENVVKNNPDRFYHTLGLGGSYQAKGLTEKAYSVYTEALYQHRFESIKDMLPAQQFYMAQMYFNLGLAANGLGKKDEFISSLHAAVAIAPKEPFYTYHLGIAYYQLSIPEKAIFYLNQVEKRFQNAPYLHYYLGSAYLQINNKVLAKEHLDHALTLFHAAGDVVKEQEVEAMVKKL
ncbi:MAG: hypothetical protein KBD53_01655 [Candidatus Omnitrophica bacterium]|nr:hypothetical protein [Candidatus Omnitrophota bacterium]